MIPKPINKILKHEFVLYALTVYTFRVVYRLIQEKKYNRLIVFSATGLITTCFSNNYGAIMILCSCVLWAFNYYKLTYEPFSAQLNNMDDMLNELENIMGDNTTDVKSMTDGKKMLDILTIDNKISDPDFKKTIMGLLDSGPPSSTKADLHANIERLNEGLDKMNKIGRM